MWRVKEVCGIPGVKAEHIADREMEDESINIRVELHLDVRRAGFLFWLVFMFLTYIAILGRCDCLVC